MRMPEQYILQPTENKSSQIPKKAVKSSWYSSCWRYDNDNKYILFDH